jgi:hypothetical protein
VMSVYFSSPQFTCESLLCLSPPRLLGGLQGGSMRRPTSPGKAPSTLPHNGAPLPEGAAQRTRAGSRTPSWRENSGLSLEPQNGLIHRRFLRRRTCIPQIIFLAPTLGTASPFAAIGEIANLLSRGIEDSLRRGLVGHCPRENQGADHTGKCCYCILVSA